MPLYEFICQMCGERFEARQSIAEHERKVPACPRCHSEQRVERILSVFTAQTSRKA
jgi:putative FmdB family regulatory protein